jgi:peptidoglycan/xylan/chitin deacetylase (PgdA/CDA1 family)
VIDVVTGSARRLLAQGMVWTGVAARARARQGARVRIVMYHGVLPRLTAPSALGNLFVSTAAFARQLTYLRRSFNVIALAEAAESLSRGGVLPDRAAVVTIDDGYRNTITAALPVLEAMRMPATVFVPAAMAGGPGILWFDGLRLLVLWSLERRTVVDLGAGVLLDGRRSIDPEAIYLEACAAIHALPSAPGATVNASVDARCAEAGLTGRHPEFHLAGWDEWRRATRQSLLQVGSHALEHGDLTKMTDEEQVRDLTLSRQRIEQELGTRCLALAYPYGHVNAHVVRSAERGGYACAVTTEPGLSGLRHPPLLLHRTMAGDKGSQAIFRARVSGAWPPGRRSAGCACE